MESKPKYIIQPTKGFLFYLCIAVGIGLIIGSYFVFSNTFKKQYPQLIDMFGGMFMIVIGGYFVYYYTSRKIIYIYDDFVVLKSGFFSKKVKIRFDEIESWAEVKKKSKHSSWDELYIFTASKKYSFASSNYDDYYTLREKIKSDKTRNTEYEKKWDTKSVRLISSGLFILGLVLLFFGLKPLIFPDTDVAPNPLIKTNQIVTGGIKIKRSKHSRSIELRFNDYPEFEFRIGGDGLDAMYAQDFVAEVSIGDTLTVAIPKDVYEKKMIKTAPLTFWDKYFRYYTIEIFEVSHGNRIYLTAVDYDAERASREKSNIWIATVIGALILAAGIFIYSKRKEIVES